MSLCKNCGKSGFFLSVDSNGLCKNCAPIVYLAAEQRIRIMNDSVRLVTESKKMKTRLSRCDLILEHAEALLKYEEKGISVISPPPSKFIEKYTEMRDLIVLEGVNEEVEKSLEKAEIETSHKKSANEISKALIKIKEGKRELKNPSMLDELESKIESIKYKTELNEYIENAQRFEFKGKERKALDQYQEALFFIKSKKIENIITSDKINEIENKINELSE